MHKLIWTLQILLTLAMALFGLQKVFMAIPDLIDQGMLWIEDFAVWLVRAIGALEVLGAIGLNAPHLIKRLPMVLSPIAATGLGLTMIGAITTHVTRHDPAASVVVTSVLLAMSAAVAAARFRGLEAPSTDPVPVTA